MDALVAEKVMGWTKEKTDINDWFEPFSRLWKPEDHDTVLPPYSVSIAAAWKVVQEMSAKNFWAYMNIFSSYCTVTFTGAQSPNEYNAEASTYELPLAICRAALRAVMEL
jgi:hypothetical protein